MYAIPHTIAVTTTPGPFINPTQIQVIEVPKPKLMDPEDAIIKITGTTVCGR